MVAYFRARGKHTPQRGGKGFPAARGQPTLFPSLPPVLAGCVAKAILWVLPAADEQPTRGQRAVAPLVPGIAAEPQMR